MAGLECGDTLFYRCNIDRVQEYQETLNSETTKTKMCFLTLSKIFVHHSIYNMYDSDLYE